MKNETNTYRATHRFARISPRKARFVMDQIRGQTINKALEILRFNSRRGSHMINKVVRSALANAEWKNREIEDAIDLETLVVVEARVDQGPTMKRWRPRARGMVFQILKRTSHLHVALGPIEGDGPPSERE